MGLHKITDVQRNRTKESCRKLTSISHAQYTQAIFPAKPAHFYVVLSHDIFGAFP